MNCKKEWHIDSVVEEEWMGYECDKWVCGNEKCMELLRLHMKSSPLAKIKMFNVKLVAISKVLVSVSLIDDAYLGN